MHASRLLALALLAVLALAIAGCSSASAEGIVTRSYGTPDPCQLTTMQLQPKDGVDLEQAAQKLVGAYEGYQGIADVTLDVDASSLQVSWCNSMQSEQGVIRAVALTGLVNLGSVQTVQP